MSDDIIQAMSDAKWDQDVLDRRIRIWELKAAGLNIRQISKKVPEVTERQIWRDWARIKKLLQAAAAPRLEEIRTVAFSRLERILGAYTSEIASQRQKGESVNPALLRGARETILSIAELYGALDRRALALVNVNVARTPLEEFEAKANGNGSNGNGIFSGALPKRDR